MLDPVAVRSYLGSLGQQGGGAGQGAGGVAAMLANLRQRLYGPQALQGIGQAQGANPAAGMPNGVPPRLQALAQQDPAAAQARYAQFQAGQLEIPTMSLGRIPGQQNQTQIQSFPMPPARRGVAQQNPQGQSVAGVPSGDGPFGPAPPGATWVPDPNMADTGGGMFRNAEGQPVDFQGRPLPGFGGGPAASGPFSGQPLPVARPTFQPGGGLMAPAEPSPGPAFSDELPPALATYPAANQGPAYGADGIMGQLPGAGARVKPTGPGGPSPTVLGADQFRGPNARRIVNARQGIFNNVQQALRKPPPQQPQQRPATGGGKVGR